MSSPQPAHRKPKPTDLGDFQKKLLHFSFTAVLALMPTQPKRKNLGFVGVTTAGTPSPTVTWQRCLLVRSRVG